MKLKYLFTALVAILALFTSCNDDQTLDTLGKVQVSQSFVSIPVEGGVVHHSRLMPLLTGKSFV